MAIPVTKKATSNAVIAATVTFDPEAVGTEVLESAGSDYGVVLLLPEFSDDAVIPDRRVENGLGAALRQQGFTIYDSAFVASDKPLSALADSSRTGSAAEPSRQLSAWYCASWTILGRISCVTRQTEEGLVSCRTHCDARAVNLISGVTVPFDSYDTVGVSDTPEKARNEALKHLAVKMASTVPLTLVQSIPRHRVRIDLTRIPSASRHLIAEHLRKMPGVEPESVKEEQTGVPPSVTAITRERPEALAVQLGLDQPGLDFHSAPASTFLGGHN